MGSLAAIVIAGGESRRFGAFADSYKAGNRDEREKTERFKAFTYVELMSRDKANLDIIWLKDESLEDAENLPAPEVIAQEIVEELQAALNEFAAIAEALSVEEAEQ
ncbi:MAG: hypothetical protein ACO3YU_05935 [Candidatus Nanopelagicales bacterium]